MRYFYSFYTDSFKIALQSILAHKLRAFLTLIGIIIGVASVVLVGASIDGLNSYIIDRISKVLGSNHFMIARFANAGRLSEEEWEEMIRRNKRIEWDEYEWIKEQCTRCSQVGAQKGASSDLKHDGQELFGTQIMGVTANMADIEDKTIIEGRFILEHEVQRVENVCVIGYDLKDKFFIGSDPIGKTVKIKDIPMLIVGIEEKRGSMFGQSMDNHVYIPITTHDKLFGRRQSIQLHGKSANREEFQGALEQAHISLRNKRKLKGNDKDTFGMIDVEQANNQVDQFTGAIAGVVVPITFISLLVGGIVVMNIMLVSVTERTFEIGLRKALGAKRSQIMMQFLIESSLLSAFGGVFGLLLAAGLSSLIKATTPVPMNVTLLYIVLSVAVSGGIGMIFGIYPAYKAARLDPIIALAKK